MTLSELKIKLNIKRKKYLIDHLFKTTSKRLKNKRSEEILDEFFLLFIKKLNVKEFVECGARDAGTSKLLADKGLNCMAIEANPISFQKFTLPNSNKIKIFNLGLGNFNKKIDFFLPKNNLDAANSTFQKKENNEYDVIKLKVVKLDDLIKEVKFGLKNNALWIDVEGYQKQVLEGAGNYLRNLKLKIIKIEVEDIEHFKDQTLSKDIDIVLKEFGFNAVVCDFMSDSQYNVIYIRKNCYELVSELVEELKIKLISIKPGYMKTFKLFTKNQFQLYLSFSKKILIKLFGKETGNTIAAFLGSKTSKKKQIQ